MRVHIDRVAFGHKPKGAEIGGIKARFTDPANVYDLSAEKIAKLLCKGHTIQPAVTPFSEKSRAAGKKGTVAEDFAEQTLFLNDFDNNRTDIPYEMPGNVAKVLAGYNLLVSFGYHSFSSTPEHEKFRIALVSDEPFMDKVERDRVMEALIRLFPQADADCVNADRMFFGTDKGLIDGIGDINAVCKKFDLLALADSMMPVPLGGGDATKHTAPKDDVIAQGQRNSSLSRYAGQMLKRHGDTPEARVKFDKKAAKCQSPLELDELDTIYKSAQKFLHDVVETQAGYISPDSYNGGLPPFVFLDGNGRLRISAPGLAKLFSEDHPYKIVTGTGDPKIYLYENGVYRPAIPIEIEKILADYVSAYNPGMLSPSKITEAHKDLYLTGTRHDIEEFNTDENMICFQNCLYDFINRKQYPHNPDKLFTIQLGAELPNAPVAMPVIDAYMADLMKGNPDGELLLYEFSGVAFSNVKGWRFKKALFLIGSGDSGKTQVKHLVELILGKDYFNNTDLTTLETNSFASSGFQGKRLCGSNDMSFMRAPEINTFKQLTGGDHIDAERKFENSYSFRYDGVLWFVGNQMPLFGGDKGDHVYNRIIPLRCDNVIPPERQIKNLCDLMFEERSGFILRALEAAREAILRNYTYTIPHGSTTALDRYKSDNSEIKQFIEEWTVPTDGAFKKNHTTAAVFKAYKRWCEVSNAKVRLSKGMFRRELFAALGLPSDTEPTHTSAGNFFPVMLTDDALKEAEEYYLC